MTFAASRPRTLVAILGLMALTAPAALGQQSLGYQGGASSVGGGIGQPLNLLSPTFVALAALGMLLNRAPLYAGPEDVVAPELVERAYDAFARLDWADPELVELQTLFLRAARVIGNRALDVRQSVRGRIAGKLEKLGLPASRTARLRAHMPISPAERLGLVGEALPPGLILGDG